MRVTLRTPFFVAAICVLAGYGGEVTAQVDWMTKLDVDARTLVVAERNSPPLWASGARHHPATLVSGGILHARLLVRVDDASARGALEAAGLRVTLEAGNVLAGRAPVSAIEAIASVQAVRSISVAQYGVYHNDAANVASRVDMVHAGVDLPKGYEGHGVIMGIVDSGIDFSHPAFQHANGDTRIGLLAEILPNGNLVWTADDINSAPETVTQIDGVGHGTHVAGIAAGGPFPQSELVGVAPGATLYIANIDGFLATDGALEAVDLLCSEALAAGMPGVVNMSLGFTAGPRDGTTDFDVAITNLIQPGCIIVASAGNQGSRILHAGYDAVIGTMREMVFVTTELPLFDPNDPDLSNLPVVEVWFDEDAVSEVKFVLYGPGPSGVEEIAVSEPFVVDIDDPDFEIEATFVVDEDTLGGVLGMAMRDPNNDAGMMRVQALTFPGVDTAVDGKYAFGLRNSPAAAGRVDAWMPRGPSGIDFFAVDPPYGQNVVDGDSLFTLDSPATAHGALSIAAYNTKNTWVDMNGQTQTATDPFTNQPAELAARTYFSSIGPTRDGRLGVTVAAPGLILASAHSADAEVPPSRLLEGGLYSMKEGTSMSSPHVAGIVALMLQINPDLTAAELAQLLHETAVRDNFTGPDANVMWGHGKVDALAAVQAALATVGTEPPITGEVGLVLEAPFPNPTRNSADLVFNIPSAGPTIIAVFDVLGRRVMVALDENLAAGPHRAQLDTSALGAGIYVVRLTDGQSGSVSRRLTVVR